MKFVDFSKTEQKEFFDNVKNVSNLSWEKLALEIGKSRSTIFNYVRGSHKIPEEVFRVLISKYNLNCNSVRLINIKHTGSKFSFPKLSPKLSEFIGALAGDGHLRLNKTPELSITCHATLDRKYANYLSNLFEELFKCKPKLYIQNNVIKLRFYSKELVCWLNKEFLIPIGKKKGQLVVPTQIFNNEKYLISYLRGLFDTDGTICRHHIKSGAIVEIISRDSNFLEQINNSLIKLEFKTNLGYKSVKIYSKENICKFFDIIGPANYKHKLKYKIFKKEGFVPLSKYIAPMV